MEINELEVVFINLFGYLEKYKFAQYCFKRNCEKLKGAKITIIDENSEVYKSLSKNLSSNIICASDYIRYFLLLNGKYILYIDLDTIISDESIDLILKNPYLSYIKSDGFANIIYSGQNKTQIAKVYDYMNTIGYLEYTEKGLDIGVAFLWEKENLKLKSEINFSYLSSLNEKVKNIIFVNESDFLSIPYYYKSKTKIFIRTQRSKNNEEIMTGYYYYSLNDLSYKEATDLIKEEITEKEKLKGLNFIHII